MDFSQLIFWRILFFSILLMQVVCVVLKCIHPAMSCSLTQKRHKLFLLVISWVMLGVVSMETLTIFLFVSIVAYVACSFQTRYHLISAHLLLGVLIPVLLMPLFYYKYADFAVNDILGNEYDFIRNLVIPVGISFYSFQVVAFCIDSLINKEPMPHFMDYMLFCSFFPQIVAGPIERKKDLLPQVENIDSRFNVENLRIGICYILTGIYFKSVLADNLASYMVTHYDGESAVVIWVNNLLFSLRIYFDFAGYGLTAWGLARCFNIRLTMNFWSPYTATNISEFWRRWHISLTSWFRDYIYFPLKGSRTKWWWLNILIVFLISGVWHGAGWNFIIWGLLIGVTMLMHRVFSKRGYSMPPFMGWLLTIFTMVYIWMFFYVTEPAALWQHIRNVADVSHYYGSFPLPGNKSDAALGILIALSALTVALEFISLKKYKEPYRIFTHPAMLIIMITLLFIGRAGEAPEFIYFAF